MKSKRTGAFRDAECTCWCGNKHEYYGGKGYTTIFILRGEVKGMKERLTEERLEQLKQRYKDFGNLHWMDAQEIVSELELVQAELTEKDATIKELEQKIKTVEQAIADGPQPFMTVEEYQAYLYSVIPFLDDGLREGENG